MKPWHRSRSFFEALAFAFRGIATAIIRERNIRIQLFLGTIILFIMIIIGVPLVKMGIAIVAILLVLAFEMMNTSVEMLSDLIHPEYSIVVRNVKDMCAGAVLIVTAASCIVGIVIFLTTIF